MLFMHILSFIIKNVERVHPLKRELSILEKKNIFVTMINYNLE